MDCPCKKVTVRPGDINWCKDFVVAIKNHCQIRPYNEEEEIAIKSKYDLTGLSEEGYIIGEAGKDDFGSIKNKYTLTIVVISENALSMLKELNFKFKSIGEYPGEVENIAEEERALVYDRPAPRTY